jgi:hypothetical protein
MFHPSMHLHRPHVPARRENGTQYSKSISYYIKAAGRRNPFDVRFTMNAKLRNGNGNDTNQAHLIELQ